MTIFKYLQMKPQTFLSLVLMVCILFFPVIVHADELDNPGGDPSAPIDGGLSILLAAGVGYGIKRMKDSRSKKK